MPQTLMLNDDYSPVQIVAWQKAITLILEDKAIMIEPYIKNGEVEYIRSARVKIPRPAIIAVKRHIDINKKKVRLSKKNVFYRDTYVCQYTGKKLLKSEATVDHIIPRARGGKDTWENLVTCCKEINTAKDDKLLTEPVTINGKQQYLKLLAKPKRPHWTQIIVKRISTERNAVWTKFLKENGFLA